MAFTASDVKALREKTGVGMMDCKKALVESDGDMDKAIDFLREKGLAAATKKASRIAAEGVVMAYTDEAKQTSVIIEVNSETDFVAKNDKFQSFVLSVAKTVINEDPKDVDDLLTKKLDGSDRTVQENLQDMVLAKIAEGKVGKYYKENCLLEQEFVKDGSMNVQKYVDSVAKKLGADIKVTSFIRYAKGEGLEKKEENFADEIANMVKG